MPATSAAVLLPRHPNLCARGEKPPSFPKHAGHGGQGRVAPRTKVQLGFLWLSPAVAEPKVPAVCVLCTRDRVCWRGAPAHSWMAGSDGSHPSRFVLWTWARNGHCGEDFNSSCLLQTRSPGRGWRRAGRSERAGTEPELGSDWPQNTTFCFLQLLAMRAGCWRCSLVHCPSSVSPRRRQQLRKTQPGLHAHLASEVVEAT